MEEVHTVTSTFAVLAGSFHFGERKRLLRERIEIKACNMVYSFCPHLKFENKWFHKAKRIFSSGSNFCLKAEAYN